MYDAVNIKYKYNIIAYFKNIICKFITLSCTPITGIISSKLFRFKF